MSTQDQNTPQQKDARPIWARLRTKATAEEAQPHHYTRADMLKQSNIWFRKQGVPLIIPARQRALDAFPRSVPWILWAGIMHICYIFLRDILLFVVEDVKGSLPNYIKALTSDSALSNEVLPVLVLGGIFLVMPIISGAFIALAHMLMVRTPQWVQITTGILTLLFAGMLFTTGVFEASTLEGIDFVYDGGQVFPPDCYRNLPRHLLGRRYRTRLVPQARHPPARLPAAHDRESTTRTHGVRALHLRECRPLEARQRAQLPAHLGCSGAHGAPRRVRGRHDLPRAHSTPSRTQQRRRHRKV